MMVVMIDDMRFGEVVATSNSESYWCDQRSNVLGDEPEEVPLVPRDTEDLLVMITKVVMLIMMMGEWLFPDATQSP